MLTVKQQYEKFPYPQPIEDLDLFLKNRTILSDHGKFWERIFPEKKRKPLKVLVAGCGTYEAALRAYCNPESQYVGIDISENSIIANDKLVKKHNIKNLFLYVSDLNDLCKVRDGTYDLIHCNGVIHHLKDPDAGIHSLSKLLKKDGALNLMVYGTKQLYALNELKKVFKKLNLKQNAESIKIIESIILGLNTEHPARKYILNSGYMSLSEKIDLYLHSQEKFYDIYEILKLLSYHRLYVKNFITPNVNRYPNDEIRKLPIMNRLRMGQILNWDDDQIEMIVSKNKKDSLVLNKIDFAKYYIHAKGSEIVIEPERKMVSFINRAIKHKKLEFDYIVADQQVFLDFFTGKIRGDEYFASCGKQREAKMRCILQIMFESGYIDVSYFSGVDELAASSNDSSGEEPKKVEKVTKSRGVNH